MEPKEEWMKYGGWMLSLLTILSGVYFLWPRIHIVLLGIALIYCGVRIFNFSTFEEYKEKRMNLLQSFLS